MTVLDRDSVAVLEQELALLRFIANFGATERKRGLSMHTNTIFIGERTADITPTDVVQSVFDSNVAARFDSCNEVWAKVYKGEY